MTSETVWEVPEPLSVCEVRLDDRTVTTVRRHGNPAGPRLVLSHGNGLAIDLYYPFWSLLAEDFDLMVYDLRNHGWNTVGVQRDHNIPTLIHDHDLVLEAIEGRYGSKPTAGIFHSVSTLIALLSFTDLYSALIFFDPPICKPAASHAEFDAAAERAAARTRRRGHRFATQEEFAELLRYMPGFLRTVPGVRRLMARTTLRWSAEEGFTSSGVRASTRPQITDYVRSFSPLLDFEILTCPAKVIGADPTLPYAYLPSFDLSHVLTVDYDFLPEATHNLQLELPAQCAAMVRDFLERNGIA